MCLSALHEPPHEIGAANARADSLYLAKCQVDSPPPVVDLVWSKVRDLRPHVGKVIDFGAGDGRFCPSGQFVQYLGFEIDPMRIGANLPENATIEHSCAFDTAIDDADVAIGNPPYVRNQDLPTGWRKRAAAIIYERTGIAVSGLANAWQYFLLLSIASVAEDGIVALVIPFEWVSRPSSRQLRQYIRENGWAVDVYRLADDTFEDVLTTASITIIDKKESTGQWRYLVPSAEGFSHTQFATGTEMKTVPYSQNREDDLPHVKRGLSPGTQQALVLKEGERARLGLEIDRDVVRCIASLRNLPQDDTQFTVESFNKFYRDAGARCWLIRTDVEPSQRLATYLASVPAAVRDTATCRNRQTWWKFAMPKRPDMLVAQAFKATPGPKIVENKCGARAVGGVAGIYLSGRLAPPDVVDRFRTTDFRHSTVPYANGLRKLEIGQLASILSGTQE